MIDVTLRAGTLDKRREDAVVIPLLAGRKLTTVCNHLPKETAEFLKIFLRNFDTKGGFGDMHTLYQVPGLHCYRLVLVGTGEEKSLTLDGLRRLSAKVSRKLEKSGARSAALYLADAEARGTSLADRVQAVSEGITLGLYTFKDYKTKKNEQHRPLQRAFVMILERTRETLATCQQALVRGLTIAEGVNFTRNLANQPGNVCTPEYIAAQALSLQDDRISVEVMDKAAIEAAGFRALLAVNQGSAKEPRFIVLRYNGAADDSAPIALVGKGLTFDAGGINLKPGAQMDEMKYDMCGSATVLGVFKAANTLGLKANLLGVIPSTENLLGAAAFKPGDIITAYNGTTIEVLNTDAEGRLILADALAWAAEQNPAEIIDFATLTGACVVALGSQASGLMGNHKPLLKALSAAGDRSHDRVWELPMYEEYQKQIDSHIADIRNIGGRGAGTITAACFLSRFIGEHHWAHVDIAGTAWNMKGDDLAAKGATGVAVRLTLDYLTQRFAMDDSSEAETADADS